MFCLWRYYNGRIILYECLHAEYDEFIEKLR